MRFCYEETFKVASPEAYETLLLDVMLGDATLFMRTDRADSAWSVLMPILNVWAAVPPKDLLNYAAGTWGSQTTGTLPIPARGGWWHPVPPGSDQL